MSNIKRLQKDLLSLTKEPLFNANAAPSEDDMTLWNGVILVELTDVPRFKHPTGERINSDEDIGKKISVPFHFLIDFPDNYPLSAPNVGFTTSFPYNMGASYSERNEKSRLYGKLILCLDLLGNFGNIHKEWENSVGSGWSPAYSVKTLLINLQALLSDLDKNSRDKKKKGRMINSMFSYAEENPEKIPECLTQEKLDDEKAQKELIEKKRLADKAAAKEKKKLEKEAKKREEKLAIAEANRIAEKKKETEAAFQRLPKKFQILCQKLEIQNDLKKLNIMADFSFEISLKQNKGQSQLSSSASVPDYKTQQIEELKKQFGNLMSVFINSVNNGTPMPTFLENEDSGLDEVLSNISHEQHSAVANVVVVNNEEQGETENNDNRIDTMDESLSESDTDTDDDDNDDEENKEDWTEEIASGPIIDENIICYVTNSNYTEDILGYGLSIVQQGNHINFSTPAELLSLTAFNNGCRHSTNKSKFEYFIPAFINQEHINQQRKGFWLSILCSSITKINKEILKAPTLFYAAIEVFSRLINTLCVEMMKHMDERQSNKELQEIANLLEVNWSTENWKRYQAKAEEIELSRGRLGKSPSIAYFEAICSLWRTFYYMSKLPQFKQISDANVEFIEKFVTSSFNRHKNKCSDVGSLLVCYSIVADQCRYNSQKYIQRNALTSNIIKKSHFIKALLDECFIRQVRYYFDELKTVQNYNMDDDFNLWSLAEKFDLSEIFNKTQVSLDNIAFQIMFLNLVIGNNLNATANLMDKTNGKAESRVDCLQRNWKLYKTRQKQLSKDEGLGSWKYKEWFRAIQFPQLFGEFKFDKFTEILADQQPNRGHNRRNIRTSDSYVNSFVHDNVSKAMKNGRSYQSYKMKNLRSYEQYML